MHYHIYLVLEGFFVQILAPDRQGPIAVVRDSHILDVNKEARKRGITPGMEKRTARAIAHETEFLNYQEDRFEDAQDQWLDLCTEFTGIIEPEEQNSAYLDLSGHPNPIDVSEKLIRTIVKETGLQVFYGSSRSKWMAKLAAQVGDCERAASDPEQFLAGLPVSKLAPVCPEHRARLNFLGYRTIGQISTIPPEVLREQFGAQGMFIARAAKGDFMDPPAAIYPRDSLIESMIFDGPIESLETIDLVLKELSQRTATRLSNMGMQGQELCLSVEMESGETKSLKRRFSKPIHNFPGALSALRTLFEESLTATPQHRNTVTPTSNSDPSAHTSASSAPLREIPALSPSTLNAQRSTLEFISIRLTLTNLVPNRGKQRALIGNTKGDSTAAVNVVRTVFGDTAVQLGSEIPVPRRVKVLREWKNAIGWS